MYADTGKIGTKSWLHVGTHRVRQGTAPAFTLPELRFHLASGLKAVSQRPGQLWPGAVRFRPLPFRAGAARALGSSWGTTWPGRAALCLPTPHYSPFAAVRTGQLRQPGAWFAAADLCRLPGPGRVASSSRLPHPICSARGAPRARLPAHTDRQPRRRSGCAATQAASRPVSAAWLESTAPPAGCPPAVAVGAYDGVPRARRGLRSDAARGARAAAASCLALRSEVAAT